MVVTDLRLYPLATDGESLERPDRDRFPSVETAADNREAAPRAGPLVHVSAERFLRRRAPGPSKPEARRAGIGAEANLTIEPDRAFAHRASRARSSHRFCAPSTHRWNGSEGRPLGSPKSCGRMRFQRLHSPTTLTLSAPGLIRYDPLIYAALRGSAGSVRAPVVGREERGRFRRHRVLVVSTGQCRLGSVDWQSAVRRRSWCLDGPAGRLETSVHTG